MTKVPKSIDFTSGYSYVLIYVFEINDTLHRGYVKVGKATLKTTTSVDKLFPNCSELNQAAKERINSYTKTASIQYRLLYTELAIWHNPKHDNKLEFFQDTDVHRVLKNSGIKKAKLGENNGNEWFYTNVETVKNAITCVKDNQKVLCGKQIIKQAEKIVFRPEQEEAINSTVKRFKKNGSKMLWNAKMRFGKTLSALEVIRQLGYKKSIIITHRPIVNASWHEDFEKIFGDTDYIYCSRGLSESEENTSSALVSCLKGEKPFIYFASIQDLRGSQRVGGKFNKNNEVFDTNWDLVVIDEAHEGTRTFLGDNVIKNIIKGETKAIYLSGTPFNIIKDFEDDETYTWDYIMEQREKTEWDMRHFGDSNPYEGLPQLNIYTYDIAEAFPSYEDIEDKAFNFREFFRVWTGKLRDDGRALPTASSVGKFVHEKDVRQFLKRLCEEDADSKYPFSEKRFQEYFNHSLWMVPGVKEAKALKELMEESNSPFSMFKIVNVAGEEESEDEKKFKSALEKLNDAIGEHPEQTYTITLSCGRLTTGVSVPAWTAVLMLSGSSSTSASSYLQTIFRVQTPANIDGKIKDKCYVFDFAPDRTLQMVAEAGKLGTRPGKRDKESEGKMREFLNFCPVIAIKGSEMRTYDVDTMLKQLKRFYAARVAQNGFDDVKLYNDELLKLTELDLKKFEDLKKIVGESKASDIKRTIEINKSDLGSEELEDLEDLEKKSKKKCGKELTPEEKERLAQLKGKAISILRSISIRIPLMVYGSDKSIDEDITIDSFADMIDDISWNEFMPKGVTKSIFNDFIQYYDKDIFIEAGNQIRRKVKAADELPPTERIKKIAEIFNTFKNPDKETVLTPWRVVNLHLGETLGGYDFFDEKHEDILDSPRFVDNGEITKETLSNVNAKILEINSKSGLYPLYVAYSLYRARLQKDEAEYKIEDLYKYWDEAVKENVFVVCKTPMAQSITKRTLIGYRNEKCNTHHFEDLINQFKNKSDNVVKKIKSPSYWGLKGIKEMEFDAVVGNPPYQEETVRQKSKTNGQSPRRNVFHYFQIVSDVITSNYTSLIYPGARWIHRSGKGLAQFGLEQINDPKLMQIDFYADSQEIFKEVAIGDGISIVLKSKKKASKGFFYVYHKNDLIKAIEMDNPGEELILLNPSDNSIIRKVKQYCERNNLKYVFDRVLPRSLFGIESNFVEDNPSKVREYNDGDIINYTLEIKLLTNDKAGKMGRSKWFVVSIADIPSGQEYIGKWKVIVSSANAGGQKRDRQLEVVDNHSAFGRSRVALGAFDTKEEAINYYNYINSVLIKYLFLMTDEALTSLGKMVPDIGDYTKNNKIIDFSKDIDMQLYGLFKITNDEQNYISSVLAEKQKNKIPVVEEESD